MFVRLLLFLLLLSRSLPLSDWNTKLDSLSLVTGDTSYKSTFARVVRLEASCFLADGTPCTRQGGSRGCGVDRWGASIKMTTGHYPERRAMRRPRGAERSVYSSWAFAEAIFEFRCLSQFCPSAKRSHSTLRGMWIPNVAKPAG